MMVQGSSTPAPSRVDTRNTLLETFAPVALSLLMGIGLPSLLGTSPEAVAQQTASPQTAPQSKPLARPFPAVVTMAEKVAASNHIFIGTGVRFFYVDRFYREVPYEQRLRPGDTPGGAAMIEVRIDRDFLREKDVPPATVALFLTSTSPPRRPLSRGSGDEADLTERFVGKSAIYFTVSHMQRVRDWQLDSAPVVGNVRLHRLVTSVAHSGPTENPLPMSYFDEVTRAVNQRLEIESLTGGGPVNKQSSPR